MYLYMIRGQEALACPNPASCGAWEYFATLGHQEELNWFKKKWNNGLSVNIRGGLDQLMQTKNSEDIEWDCNMDRRRDTIRR